MAVAIGSCRKVAEGGGMTPYRALAARVADRLAISIMQLDFAESQRDRIANNGSPAKRRRRSSHRSADNVGTRRDGVKRSHPVLCRFQCRRVFEAHV